MSIKFANFARSTLAVGISTLDTTIVVASTTGARFPTLAVGDYFYATLENAALAREIVKVTARSTDTLTVVRAQDGTSAASWVTGDTISLRLNAAAMTDTIGSVVLKNSGDTGAAALPSGTTAERPGTPTTGNLRYNSTTNQFEGYGAAGWGSIGGGAVANETLLETKHNITADYTLTTGASALTIGQLSVATGKAVTIPSGEAVVAISTTPTPAANDVTPITTGAQTIYGQKTFTKFPNIAELPSMVRVNTSPGYGSSSTCIRRFTGVVASQGTDITYADSATTGSSFTINTSGVYAISYSDNFAANAWMGITLNTSLPASNITSCPTAEIIALLYTPAVAGAGGNAAATLYLPAGSVLRAHTSGGAGSTSSYVMFTVTRVA